MEPTSGNLEMLKQKQDESEDSAAITSIDGQLAPDGDDGHREALRTSFSSNQAAPSTSDPFPALQIEFGNMHLNQDDVQFQNNLDVGGGFRISRSDVERVLRKFRHFKQFDTVVDYSDHHYAPRISPVDKHNKNWVKAIQNDWKILKKDLPEGIFVRAYEEMSLMRAVIVGTEGTPYHNGLFFFDIYFPSSYPNEPPEVNCNTYAESISPLICDTGKIRLSLLNTWCGDDSERWMPCVSTILQVLLSIQWLVLTSKPFFDEIKYGYLYKPKYIEYSYNASHKIMVLTLINMTPKHFEDFVLGHFCKNTRNILEACESYTTQENRSVEFREFMADYPPLFFSAIKFKFRIEQQIGVKE